MKKVILGKTGLQVTKTAMGCLPVQRCSEDDGVKLIRAAYEGGINFFDTANAYTDSEMKVGRALFDVRGDVIIATKSQARDKAGCAAHIENSLKMLRTDYIDLFQFHNCEVLPDINDPDDAFAAVLEARDAGKIRHIGITTHRITVAEAAIASGCFETLMFPFSYISADRDLALADKCMTAKEKREVKKRLAGGELDLVIGTHALLTDDVELPSLGLVITDEQHRFGVEQRAALVSKGESPHVLVMSATPIPRTLALIIYGDLDVSVIDEMPPGRQRVDTFAVDESYRRRLYAFIEKQAFEGRQTFVVCPMMMPYMPLAALTVRPWMRAATAVTHIPATGPKAKPQIRMAISAGSYSIKLTAGKIGKWISATRATDRAAIMAMVVSLRVLCISNASQKNNRPKEKISFRRSQKIMM